MKFADNMFLIDENKNVLKDELKHWREALEKNG